MIFTTLFIFMIIELLIVSYVDLKVRKVANIWSVFHILIFGLITSYNAMNGIFDWKALVIPVCFVTVGFILFVFNVAGAGDVKFISSFLLILSERQQIEFLYYLTWITVIVGGTLAIKNIILNREKILVYLGIKEKKIIAGVFGKKFPYTPLVLLAWIVFGCKELNLI
ncbi:peptidase, A24 type IV prepilin peptidase family protein [Bacteriovorax sp. BSW11_IV]|nr:peptidase, A24 type IV prepilin peptidase family protein [Bacteriovorax sp. BSW11_IV]